MADAIKCDHCGSYTERPMRSGYMQRTSYGIQSMDKPNGWITLVAYQEPHDPGVVSDLHGEFCSWQCAAAWFTEYVNVPVANGDGAS